MISFIYKKSTDTEAKTRNEFTYGAWVYVETPTDDELAYITDTFKLDSGLLNDALDINEVPRIEQEDGIIYLFTRFVIQLNNQFITTPVLIIYKKKLVITVVPKHVPQLYSLISRKGTWSTYDAESLVLLLLTTLNSTIERCLINMSRLIQQSRIQVEKIGNRELMQFVDVENSLHDINVLLVRLENLISTLLKKSWFKGSEEEEELLKDIYLAVQQMLDIVKVNIRTVVNTRDALSTIMTANLNRVIKLFTSLTVLLTVPMLVATFYGMNIQLPLADSSQAFIIIMSGVAIVSVSLTILFIKKDWL